MIKVLIADDHAIFRQSLRSIIESQTDISVVAEAEDGVSALRKANYHHPDVILMDINMPKMNGIDATSRIHKRFDDIKIIALSNYTEDLFVEKMLEAGASDYIEKTCSRDELIEHIRSAGEAILPRTLKP